MNGHMREQTDFKTVEQDGNPITVNEMIKIYVKT